MASDHAAALVTDATPATLEADAHTTVTTPVEAPPAGSSDNKGPDESLAHPGCPACYLIVHNVSKKANIGNMVRSAVAFGVKQFIVVGSPRFATFGAQGTAKHIDVVRFHKLHEAVAYLKARGVRICGVEILESAKSVSTHPFSGPTAFMMGNEGEGMTATQKAACDQFVYIPQFSTGTASLNVTVAASIILHHFATWAGYQEAPRDNSFEAKYLVSQPDLAKKEGFRSELDIATAEERRKARAADAHEAAEFGGFGAVSDHDVVDDDDDSG